MSHRAACTRDSSKLRRRPLGPAAGGAARQNIDPRASLAAAARQHITWCACAPVYRWCKQCRHNTGVGATTLADAVVGDRRSTVVDGRCLEDDSQGTHRTRSREQPQKQPVQYQRYVLPVLFDLRRRPTTHRKHHIYLKVTNKNS